MGLSLKPSTYLQGVGLQGICTITDAYYHSFDFNGKANAQPCLVIKVADESGREKEQNYSAGSFVAIAPSLDGKNPNITDDGEFLPGPKLCAQKENITALFADSDHAFFWEHLVNAGFPEADIDDDARVLIGMVAEFGAVPKKYTDQAGTQKARPVAVPLKVIKLPKEQKKAAAASASANAPSSDAGNVAEDTILKVLQKNGGAVQLSDLPKSVFAALVNVDAKKRMQIRNEATNPEFLQSLAEQGKLVFDLEAGIISAA